jgi:hypothetical protein
MSDPKRFSVPPAPEESNFMFPIMGFLVCLSAGFVNEIKLIIENELIYLKAAIRLTKKTTKTHGVTKIESHKNSLAYISHNGNNTHP